MIFRLLYHMLKAEVKDEDLEEEITFEWYDFVILFALVRMVCAGIYRLF
jgi:hypothetical protein